MAKFITWRYEGRTSVAQMVWTFQVTTFVLFFRPLLRISAIKGVNHWVHDVEVTNRDECVTIKSPASNILVERIWCNQSGGSAIGSMGAGTAIENILYRNVYTNGGNQIFMIKSWGGDGYLRNVLLQNFIARGTAYGLDVNQYCKSAISP